MHTCGGIWGGSGFLLIPHQNGQVTRGLRRLVRAYDPDYVVTLPMTVRQFEAVNPGVIQINDEGGKRLEGAERAAAIEQSGDMDVGDPESWSARRLLASDCTPHRHWFPGGDQVGDGPYEPTQHLSPEDHGPFTSIEQFGPLHFSDVGVPADLTGPWALAAALHLGFAGAPPLPFPAQSPVDEAGRTRLIREALRPPSYGRYRPKEEPTWNSAWQPSETGLVKVGTWQGDQKPHLVVVGNTADDFALAQGWHVLFRNSHWIPEANLLLERPRQSAAWMLGRDLANDAVYRNKRSFLTSASVPLGQLQQLAQEWYDGHIRSSWDGEPTDEDTVESEPDSRLECTPPERLNWDYGGMLAIEEDYDLPLALPAEENDQGDISLLVDLPPLTPSDSALKKAAGLTWEIDLHFLSAATPYSRGLSPRVLQAYSASGSSRA
jgi:hypothetical protein